MKRYVVRSSGVRQIFGQVTGIIFNPAIVSTWFLPNSVVLSPAGKSTLSSLKTLAELKSFLFLVKREQPVVLRSLGLQQLKILVDKLQLAISELTVSGGSLPSLATRSNAGLSAPNSRPTVKTMPPIPQPTVISRPAIAAQISPGKTKISRGNTNIIIAVVIAAVVIAVISR